MVVSIVKNDVGLENISDSFKTKNGVGICYFDPEDEILKEFNSSTKIPVYPSEKSTRRFYVVKDDISLLPNTVLIRATSSSKDYIVKVNTDETNFDEIEDGNIVIDFFSKYPNGIIPFTLYIESTTTTIDNVPLIFELEVK